MKSDFPEFFNDCIREVDKNIVPEPEKKEGMAYQAQILYPNLEKLKAGVFNHKHIIARFEYKKIKKAVAFYGMIIISALVVGLCMFLPWVIGLFACVVVYVCLYTHHKRYTEASAVEWESIRLNHIALERALIEYEQRKYYR
jgi:hypothetical protein